MGIRNHGEAAGAENNAMRSPGENQLAARFTETGGPRGQKNHDLEFRSRLLDNCGGEKQTTRMRDGWVQASQIDFLRRRAWVRCVPRGKHENF